MVVATILDRLLATSVSLILSDGTFVLTIAVGILSDFFLLVVNSFIYFTIFYPGGDTRCVEAEEKTSHRLFTQTVPVLVLVYDYIFLMRNMDFLTTTIGRITSTHGIIRFTQELAQHCRSGCLQTNGQKLNA